MRTIRYNLYTELANKRLLNEEELAVVRNILGNIDIEVDTRFALNTFIINEENTLSITKFGDINGLQSGSLQIGVSDKSITIRLSGYVDHKREEMTYIYSKKPFGLFKNKHYESLFYRFETRDGQYTLSAFPLRRLLGLSVSFSFFSESFFFSELISFFT